MIYAFIGQRGTGKTTACNYVKGKLSGVRHINFKDALVEELQETMPKVLDVLGEIYQMTVPELFQNKPPAMRALMQNYGTELRRAQIPDYWVTRWKERVARVASLEDGKIVNTIVVDDVRFINEAEAVRSFGGMLVKLVRPDLLVEDSHVSENELASIYPHVTITFASGDYATLYKELDAVISKGG